MFANGAEQLPLTWRDRRGERRSCDRGREQALPDKNSAGVTGGESAGVSALLLRLRLQSPPPVIPALDPSGNASSRPSDTSSSSLSRNSCALPSGHTSADPPGPHRLWPPPVIPVLAAYSNPCDLPPVLPALAPPVMPAPALFRGSCAFPSGHGSDRHGCGRLLWSRLLLRVVVRRSVPDTCRRSIRLRCHPALSVTLPLPRE